MGAVLCVMGWTIAMGTQYHNIYYTVYPLQVNEKNIPMEYYGPSVSEDLEDGSLAELSTTQYSVLYSVSYSMKKS